MAKAGSNSKQEAVRLTYKQERFVEEYIRTGNGAQSAVRAGYPAISARQVAHENLTKPYIQEAIGLGRDAWRSRANIEKDDLLAILVGIATAHPGAFAAVVKNPSDEESYAGLGPSAYAISEIGGSVRSGYRIKFHNRLQALDLLWEKLGFDRSSGGRDRLAFLDTIMSVVNQNEMSTANSQEQGESSN